MIINDCYKFALIRTYSIIDMVFKNHYQGLHLRQNVLYPKDIKETSLDFKAYVCVV